MAAVIAIDGAQLLGMLAEHHWVQGSWTTDDGGACAHQVIRWCQPVPGDAYLIEQAAARQGWGTEWNDAPTTTEAMVRDRLGRGIEITDADLAATFGPQWRAVVALVRRAAALTADDARRLAAAGAAAWDAAGDAAWAAARDAAGDAAWAAARDAARAAAWDAAWDAAGDAARDAARDAAGDAAWAAARDAALAAASWDLATDDGLYTTARRDLLMAPWREVCGLPATLVEAA